ncbi:MAG: hypothetical protein GY870_07695 [archaeon]|nr:hypothetical protein [archaeon]
MTIEYQDFIVYQLENDGTYTEVDVPQNDLGDYLSSETVFLLVRQDLRRLFIWKGPTSPVRKRFISSRAASEIQENIRSGGGRHLKIVSIDAGDETIEFLSAFDVEPFEVTEKLADMRYIRNTEREKMKQEAIKKKLEERNKKKEGEYWSPLLEEANQKEQAKKVKTIGETVPTKEEKIPSEVKKTPKKKTSVKKVKAKKAPIKRHIVDDTPVVTRKSNEPVSLNSLQNLITEEKGKKIIDEVLQIDPPEGMKRMNIVIGQNLYAPHISKSVVLGKTIEKEEWNIIKDLPSGVIDLDTNKLRVIIDEEFKIIKAIEIYQNEGNSVSNNENNKPKKKSGKKTSTKKTKKTSSKKKSKRKLPNIPTG